MESKLTKIQSFLKENFHFYNFKITNIDRVYLGLIDSKLFNDIEHFSISPNPSSHQHLKTITSNIKYVYYRWFDYEMIRRKFFNSKK